MVLISHWTRLAVPFHVFLNLKMTYSEKSFSHLHFSSWHNMSRRSGNNWFWSHFKRYSLVRIGTSGLIWLNMVYWSFIRLKTVSNHNSRKPSISEKFIQKLFWNFHFPGRHTGRFTGKPIHLKAWVAIQFFQFWGVTQTVLLENSSIRIFWLKPSMICNIWTGWVFH